MGMRTGIATMVSVSMLGALACTVEDTGDDSNVGGSGSAGSSGGDPMLGMGGSSSGETCAASGVGNVEIQITGLPTGVAAALTLTGPGGVRSVSAAGTLEALGAGSYTVAAARVADTDPIVRTLYEAALGETQFCLSSGGSHSVQLAYSVVPSSHRLWTNNSNGSGNLLGFSSSLLSASASREPAVSVTAGAGIDVTFDAEGNLWSMGATLAEPHLLRFPRTTLGASGEKEPDRGITIADVPCIPAMRAFAFDPGGALWVSSCGGRISKLSGSDLAGSGEVTPSVILSTVEDNGDVAFDSAGNLWVTAGLSVLRFDAGRLGSSSAAPANLTLTVRSNDDTRDLGPSNLAFDAGGNLWVSDFGGNLLARVARASLSGTGAQSAVSEVTLALSVSALLERPAFDDSGGLWLALEPNRFGRLAPAQLLLSSTAGSPTAPETIITSPSMGYANRIAFFPAAAGLPLFHHFP
jgi:streptogramin lyase